MVVGMPTVLARRDALLEIVRRRSAGSPRLFGSFAPGEDGPESDIDVLVDAGPKRTLFSIVRMQQERAKFFGREVDVSTLAGLHPSMRNAVLSQAVGL